MECGPPHIIECGIRTTTFKSFITSFEDNFNILSKQIKKTFTKINTIAIQNTMKILFPKCKLENN